MSYKIRIWSKTTMHSLSSASGKIQIKKVSKMNVASTIRNAIQKGSPKIIIEEV